MNETEGLFALVALEVARQDEKHGPYEGTPLGRSRLALATLEDEVREALDAWRAERREPHWRATRWEVLQVAAVCIRTLRDALGEPVEDSGSQQFADTAVTQ